jgi:hypothetical protein
MEQKFGSSGGVPQPSVASTIEFLGMATCDVPETWCPPHIPTQARQGAKKLAVI